ncbi:MAG: hypothetical protein IJZ54_07660 [Clostridia bacterium]|nr:hypothetical protein [Clostridia bacterium]
MKRLLALLMVALMAVSLAACVPTPGDLNNIVNDAIDNIGDNDNDTDTDTDIDIQIGTEADGDTDVDVDIDINNVDNTQATVSFDMSAITQQVIFDDKDIKITVEELTYEEYYGPQINFLIENNSDKDIYVSSSVAIVNNVVFANYLSSEINAGKKAHEDMHFYEDDLKNVGITEIGTVEFRFNISEQETYNEIATTDMIKLVINDKVDLTRESKGEKLFSQDGITIYSEECPKQDDDYYDYVTRFFIVNENENDIAVSLEDVSVNGFMIDPYCSTPVLAGKMGYADLYFYKSDLETNKIQEIEDVEFYFTIYNSKNYSDIAESEAITIKAK